MSLETVKIGWLRVVTALKVAWVWIKEHWYMLGIGLISIFATVFFINNNARITSLLKTQEGMSKKHREEIAELQRIRDEEIRRREQIELEYRNTLEKINKEHEKALADLTRQKQAELRRIIEETMNDPEAMATRVNNLFGFQIYKP
jgi:biopolymer transport protein ExbB/TolQ